MNYKFLSILLIPFSIVFLFFLHSASYADHWENALPNWTIVDPYGGLDSSHSPSSNKNCDASIWDVNDDKWKCSNEGTVKHSWGPFFKFWSKTYTCGGESVCKEYLSCAACFTKKTDSDPTPTTYSCTNKPGIPFSCYDKSAGCPTGWESSDRNPNTTCSGSKLCCFKSLGDQSPIKPNPGTGIAVEVVNFTLADSLVTAGTLLRANVTIKNSNSFSKKASLRLCPSSMQFCASAQNVDLEPNGLTSTTIFSTTKSMSPGDYNVILKMVYGNVDSEQGALPFTILAVGDQTTPILPQIPVPGVGYCADNVRDQGRDVPLKPVDGATCDLKTETDWQQDADATDGRGWSRYCKKKYGVDSAYFYKCNAPDDETTPLPPPAGTGPCADKGGKGTYLQPICGDNGKYEYKKALNGDYCGDKIQYFDRYSCVDGGYGDYPTNYSTSDNPCHKSPWCFNPSGTPAPTRGASDPTPTIPYQLQCPSDGKHTCTTAKNCTDQTFYKSEKPKGDQACTEHFQGINNDTKQYYCCTE